jgi:hypothetical protein
MTKKKTVHTISSQVQKDLQNVAIAVGFDTVYQVGTMMDAAKKDMLYMLYHGDADAASAHISLVDQLLKGYGKFQSLFHKVPVACSDGNIAPQTLASTKGLPISHTGCEREHFCGQAHYSSFVAWKVFSELRKLF